MMTRRERDALHLCRGWAWAGWAGKYPLPDGPTLSPFLVQEQGTLVQTYTREPEKVAGAAAESDEGPPGPQRKSQNPPENTWSSKRKKKKKKKGEEGHEELVAGDRKRDWGSCEIWKDTERGRETLGEESFFLRWTRLPISLSGKFFSQSSIAPVTDHHHRFIPPWHPPVVPPPPPFPLSHSSQIQFPLRVPASTLLL